MTDKSGRNISSEAVAARQPSTQESAQRSRTASLRRHLRSITRPVRGLAALRIWVRGSEIAIVALAILAGGVSGLVASLHGRRDALAPCDAVRSRRGVWSERSAERRSRRSRPHADHRRPAARPAEPRLGALVV